MSGNSSPITPEINVGAESSGADTDGKPMSDSEATPRPQQPSPSLDAEETPRPPERYRSDISTAFKR
jgi:serine/threonine-protein kinase RIM15